VSNFRPPPDDRPPPSRVSVDSESNPSTDLHRQGPFKAPAGGADDIAPVSSRFDRMPLSQRSSSSSSSSSFTAVSINSAARAQVPGAGAPTGSAFRASKGGIYQITKLLEKKHGAFFISRLILASGIGLRGYDATSYDDPAIMSKFIKTLRNMLSPTDMADVFSQIPSLTNTKQNAKREEQ
jgi:hypothetical protein